jgi:ubiquinone/menaquinone biosynthesis C-methylase UbiE
MNSNEHQHSGLERQKKGVSSFMLHDPILIFNELTLQKGNHFLDIGCGAGDYSIQAAKEVGLEGIIYALDRWDEVIENLRIKASSQGLTNIKAMVSDITQSLPIEDNIIDVCLLATVLHIPDVVKSEKTLFTEIQRVLKPDGHMALVEIKKEDMPFGPPLHMRLSSEDVEALVMKYGFLKISYVDLGYSYMTQFKLR